ncbi:hypothetical protein Rsub_05317 [Raphidocelis subcapitata]|uniref:Uncharacterized protein n=1 Tax=Raphidocelis subcapitata TaxID=307507 RepID=A0A2V0NX72_9CHLO|nr:hypothetical protein Rsub_05317 [Raphidocelis subcapitata]|eukprot:GBF92234.1 hypothetical protein Rsub_05317 [Raphidocelis subcapitata]
MHTRPRTVQSNAAGQKAPPAGAAAAAPRRRARPAPPRALPPGNRGLNPGSSGGMGGASAREFELSMAVPRKTRGKPERDAEGQFNKFELLKGAQDWREAAALFAELGSDVDSRSAGIAAQAFCQCATLLPGPVASLPPADAAAAEAALGAMLSVIATGVERLRGPTLKDVLWRLVDTGLQRPREVAVMGVALTGHIQGMEAKEAFDAAAALALLGYRPPPPPPPPAAKPRSAKAAAAAAAEAAAASPDVVAALLRRSARALGYFTPKDTANAVFVLSKMGGPGSVDAEWLRGFCEASYDHLPQLQGEALALAGHMPARHGFLPPPAWRAAWIEAVGAGAAGLVGGEFALVLAALARWQLLAEAAAAAAPAAAPAPAAPAAGGAWSGYGGGGDAGGYGGGGGYDEGGYGEYGAGYDGDYGGGGGGGYGGGYDGYGAAAAAAPPQQPREQLPAGWLDSLLLSSHRAGALRDLSVRQLSATLRALAALGAAPPAPWTARMWAAASAKVAVAVRAGGSGGGAAAPEDVAALLADWAALPAGSGCPPADAADEAASYAAAALRKLPRRALERLADALAGCGGAGGAAAGVVAAAIEAAPAAVAPAAAKKRARKPRAASAV